MHVKTLLAFVVYFVTSPMHIKATNIVVIAMRAESFYMEVVVASLALVAAATFYRLFIKDSDMTDNEGFLLALSLMVASLPGSALMFIDLKHLVGTPPLLGILVTGIISAYLVCFAIILARKPRACES